jgi:ubiquinone/menaquinone biosynthesis C-methylase UbiE
VNMNWLHRRYCASRAWAARVRDEILPGDLQGVELGEDVLEIGPGPGLTTELLRSRVPRLTALEIDTALAESLRARLQDERVEVVTGDASAMPFEDGRFSAAVCFTMLHHVPRAELQDRLFAETRRVLRPGGIFAGSDSSPARLGLRFRLLHIGDVMNLVPPETLGARLERAGFQAVEVRTTGDGRFRWRAVAP